jgi:hypothetical protein
MGETLYPPDLSRRRGAPDDAVNDGAPVTRARRARQCCRALVTHRRSSGVWGCAVHKGRAGEEREVSKLSEAANPVSYYDRPCRLPEVVSVGLGAQSHVQKDSEHVAAPTVD